MIFLDTTYIIALINENDIHHKKALKLMEEMDYEKKMINSVVLVEVLNILDKRNTQKDIDNIVKKLYGLDKIHCINSGNIKNSINILKFFNGSINFADCTIIDTMITYRITEIISFDDDFDKVKGIKRIYI